MKCPWPALRAARAMRDADAVLVEADDPVAARELEALARERQWLFAALGPQNFQLTRPAAA